MSALPPSRLTTPRWWLAAVVAVCVLAAVTATALWQLRRDALHTQARELDLLSLTFADEIDRGLLGAEEGLRAVRAVWTEGRLAPAGPGTAQSLRLRAELMPLVQSLWLLAPDGRLLSASDATPVPALDGFAPPLAGLPADRTALAAPQGDPAHIALAVRVPAGAGTEGGWVVASMPAAALLGAFRAASTEAGARMAVRRADGVLLAGTGIGDADRQIVRHRPLAHFGVDVALARDAGHALTPWRESVRLSVAALLLLAITLALSLRYVQRADRRRALTQQALERQRARASKLQSLGTLAGGVSHDFNNVLAAIVGFGEMARDDAPAGSEQAAHLDKVLQAAARGQSLVARILAFSRGGARSAAVFTLQPVVEEVLALLSASLPPGVLLEQALDAPDARVRGDATQAFEATMNLCTNALQAVATGGGLMVSLQRVRTERPRVLWHATLPAGEHLALTVADDGPGIPPEVMERLFEPFFTTRADSGGTGLGLAVVHGVVAEFGGAVDVTSTPGRGATFTLYFPEAVGEAEPAPPPTRGDARGQGERVLVVDDDPLLVDMTVGWLEGLGYRPSGFTDAQAALAEVRASAPGDFSAVVTDEVMSSLSGTELAAALLTTHPGLPVLVVSGHGGALLAQRAREAGVAQVLSKPLRRQELAAALATALASAR